jgi:uncharacterized membrane-anchored protein
MKIQHVPVISTKYWCALVCASIFGANTGDFFASVLHLGHLAGLPVLAVLFAVALFLEQRNDAKSIAYFWFTIVVIRTAATNIGDVSHDLRLPALWVIGALTALLLVVLFTRKLANANEASTGTLATNANYWFSMLVAGALGTVIGDYFSFGLGLRPFKATLVLGAILAVAFVACKAKLRRNHVGLFAYWLTVVLIRSAGTAAGDLIAHSPLKLPLSTLVTGLVFVGVLAFWREPDDTNPEPQAQPA